MGQYGGRDFKKSGGKQDFLSREGDKGIPPGMPTGKTDSKASGKIVFLSRQGDRGMSGMKGSPKGAAPLD